MSEQQPRHLLEQLRTLNEQYAVLAHVIFSAFSASGKEAKKEDRQPTQNRVVYELTKKISPRKAYSFEKEVLEMLENPHALAIITELTNSTHAVNGIPVHLDAETTKQRFESLLSALIGYYFVEEDDLLF
jgi:hypothetical protein